MNVFTTLNNSVISSHHLIFYLCIIALIMSLYLQKMYVIHIFNSMNDGDRVTDKHILNRVHEIPYLKNLPHPLSS